MRDDDEERSLPMKIFVGGLHQDTTVEGLNAYFSQFGPASAFIMRDGQTNRSRGFGFVNFDDENTMNAVLQFQHQIDGMSITCSPYDGTRSGKGGGKGGGISSSRNSVVDTPRSLADRDDDEDDMGPPSVVETPKESRELIRSIQMETPRRRSSSIPKYRKALSALVRSRAPSVNAEPPPARMREEPHQEKAADLKLFIGGLSKDTTRDSLNAYFQVFDPEVDCYVMKDGATGRSRGFAFANFQSEVAVSVVLQQDHLVDGVTINVSPYKKGGGGGGGMSASSAALPGRAEREAVPPLRLRGAVEGNEGILPATSGAGSERKRSLSALAVAQAILAHRHTMQAAQAQAKQQARQREAREKEEARIEAKRLEALPAYPSDSAFDAASDFDTALGADSEVGGADESVWDPDEPVAENGELPPDWGVSGGQDSLMSTGDSDPLFSSADPFGLMEPEQEEVRTPQLTQLAPLEEPVVPQRLPGQELKIFVGGLSQETTKESLNAYFANFGQASSYVMLDGRTGRSRGFGFVNFDTEDALQAVLAHTHQVDGVTITCSPYKAYGSQKGSQVSSSAVTPRGGFGSSASGPPGSGQQRRSSTCKVFVGDLSKNATEDMLEEAFLAFGPNFVTVCKDSLGRCMGFGIIEFASPSAAKEALLYSPIIDGMQTDVSEYFEKECARPSGSVRSSPY